MEKIKLVLSEFSDVVNIKMMNPNIEINNNDLYGMSNFIDELEIINKTKKEKDYAKILEEYKTLIEKIAKISTEALNNSDVLNEKNEIKENNPANKNNSKDVSKDNLSNSKINNSKQ